MLALSVWSVFDQIDGPFAEGFLVHNGWEDSNDEE